MQIAILGLGRFGSHLALQLARQGHDVLGIDADDAVVNGFADRLARAAIADINDIDALRELSLADMEAAVVATADLEASVLATMNAQTLGVPQIFAKARSDRHALILERLGADRVMRPERDGAERAAHLIQFTGARDFLPLTDAYGIAVFEVPPLLVGQPLEAALSAADAPTRKLMMTVANGEIRLNPIYSETMNRGDLLVFAAEDDDHAKGLLRR